VVVFVGGILARKSNDAGLYRRDGGFMKRMLYLPLVGAHESPVAGARDQV